MILLAVLIGYGCQLHSPFGAREALPVVRDLRSECDRTSPALRPSGYLAGPRVKLGMNHNPVNSNDDTIARDLELHAELGAWGTRLPVEWSRIEPQPGSFQWEHVDRFIATSLQNGLEPWALVSGAPDHACRPGTRTLWPGGSCPPQTELYEAFLRVLATRYRGKVHYYEIWNEPDFEYFWTGGATPAEYADLLVGAHGAIKASDPEAQVVMAGTAGTKLPYLGAILRHLRGAKVFDAVSIHPYRTSSTTGLITVGPHEKRPVDDENGRKQTVDFLGEMRLHRNVLDAAGYTDVPMWITEFGWGAHDEVGGKAFVTLTQQARYLTQTYDTLSRHPDLQVPGLFWYTITDWATNPLDTKAQWQYGFFGLVRRNRSAKPAACAYLRLAERSQESISPP
jgi:polysaccharide biosynthesis protein PslG